MSMNAELRSVSSNVLTKLLDDPSLVELVTLYRSAASAPPKLNLRALSNASESFRASIEASFNRLANATGPAGAAQLARHGVAPQELDDPLSLNKAWMGVHRLLAGDNWKPTTPPENLVLGGVEIGNDRAYGRLRFLTAQQVGAAAAAAAQLDLDTYRLRFNADDFEQAQVYPGGWDQPDVLDWLLGCLTNLQAYYTTASRQDRAMLLWIS